ncbi:MAG: hypothetical protein ACREXT_12630, partial [Gammaproteobacteria bacterium]
CLADSLQRAATTRVTRQPHTQRTFNGKIPFNLYSQLVLKSKGLHILSRADLLAHFDALPAGAIVSEDIAAAVRNRKVSSLQRERWEGSGPSYIKDGRRVGYRKSDLVEYLNARRVTAV